ncbi:protein disulfide-isomerase 5-1-like [Arachis duranensis]|uniref:Protein disulfide-isomerase 5-1-like n=1 Tax=Arachis duranensis TaxID=130453 RepID=A0A9C6T3T2_ARADU|nr:protein disulfide-isomerase 5-1-like [Arachis duranensis]
MNSVESGSSNLCINDTLTDDELRSILAMVSHACSNWTLPSPFRGRSIPASPIPTLTSLPMIKEKDTAWFVKFCVSWCKHCKNLGTLWDDLGKAIEGTNEIKIGEVDCGDHQRSFVAYAYNVVSHLIEYQHCQDTSSRDVDSLKNFVLEEDDKAATNAQAQQLDNDREL